MPNYHCIYGTCLSDSRRPEDKNLKFLPFAKPWNDRKQAERWVHLIGRKNFTVDDITQNSYICVKHFPKNVELNWKNWKKNKTLEPYPALSLTIKTPQYIPYTYSRKARSAGHARPCGWCPYTHLYPLYVARFAR